MAALVPELSVPDPAAAEALLMQTFRFSRDGGLLRLGSQSIIITQAAGVPGHGPVDHLALSVPDIDAAARDLIALGAQVDTEVTPHGPAQIAEFWRGGVRYLFLKGPGGARIELCCNLAEPAPPGHDHIGIPCSDIAATTAFFAGLGASSRAHVRLDRPDGTTWVHFMALGDGTVELYQPPGFVTRPPGGLWGRLRLEGLGQSVPGPDGLLVAPL